MFLGASFGLEAPQVVHAGVEAGSGEHGDAHGLGLETEQDFQAVREEATEEGAGGGRECGCLVRFRKRKPTFVSSENPHKQGALGLPDEGERVSKAHKDTIS